MAIEIRTGDLFASGAHTLVNPVNCVGVMGAGLALQFKRRYPEMYARYREQCRAGDVSPGSVTVGAYGKQHIANLATKSDWREKSRLGWVDEGLVRLARYVREEEVPSVAVPPLGCGFGGLDYSAVLPRMLRHLGALEGRVMLYGDDEQAALARKEMSR